MTFAVALERFKPVARWYTEVFEAPRDLQLSQLASRNRLDLRKPLNPPAVCEGLRVCRFERYDHGSIISRCVIIVKRHGGL